MYSGICSFWQQLKKMIKIKYLIILLISIKAFGQTKPIEFYNENGEKITKEEFFESKDPAKNLDIYFEDDSLQFGLLITRLEFGQLDPPTFTKLKSYLTEISQTQIDSTQNIVINYLTAYPKREGSTKPRSTWNVLDRNYLKRLHKIADIKQFWINSPQADNLKFYHHNKINWIADEENLLKKLFFPYEAKHGHYILIRSNGKFYYYLGEHSKYQIWEDAEKFFK